MTTLKANADQTLQAALDDLALGQPGTFLTVVGPETTLFSGYSGKFDFLDTCPEAKRVDQDTVVWLSSAAKLTVTVAYLHLVDRGVLTLDTPMAKYSSELAETSSRVLQGFTENDTHAPVFVASEREMTLAMMLGDTSGFSEFDPLVHQWKSQATRGTGPINSCKIDNLIYTPPVAQPGEVFQYGTNADWLSFIFPKVAGVDLDTYLQQFIFRPLGMASTTFYPFDEEVKARLMPLVWRSSTHSQEKVRWEAFEDQMAVHKLPRTRREDIEYPVGGGGIYSTAQDWATLLQYILKLNLGLEDTLKVLSPSSAKLILAPRLEEQQKSGLSALLNFYFDVSGEDGEKPLTASEVNYSLAFALYTGSEAKLGWGRQPGSGGWGGAACTDYWIDIKSGIAAIYTTQVLPGSGPVARATKKDMERRVYEALEL